VKKRHYKQETLLVQFSDSAFVTSNEKNLTECLYSSKSMKCNQNGTTFFSEHEDESAIHELTELIEGALTEKECLEAQKTPGTD